jgi:hypothetical protein
MNRNASIIAFLVVLFMYILLKDVAIGVITHKMDTKLEAKLHS